jgi:hypothetical protein
MSRCVGRQESATTECRAWFRALLRDLAAEAGAADPDGLARQLHLLYDGMAVTPPGRPGRWNARARVPAAAGDPARPGS